MTESTAIVIEVPLTTAFGTEAERAAVRAFADALSAALDKAGAGDVDGDGFGEHVAEIFVSSTDASAVGDIATRIAHELKLTVTVAAGDD